MLPSAQEQVQALGAAGVVLLGGFLFGESLDPVRIGGVALIAVVKTPSA